MGALDFIPAMLIAVIGTVTDIRYGRVRNRHLLTILSIWLCWMIGRSISMGHILLTPLWGVNVALAFMTSLAFYFTDIWAPGDCKMYTALAIVFPMYAYTVRDGNIFPSLDLVIFAFALGYIALLGISLYNRWAKPKGIIRQRIPLSLSAQQLYSIAANVGVISALTALLDTFSGDFYAANQMLCTLAIITIVCTLHRQERIRQIAGAAGLIYVLASAIIRGRFDMMPVSLSISVVISVILEIIRSAASVNIYRVVSGDEVKAGMILSFTTIMAMRICIDPNIPRVTTENRRSRITEVQAEAVRLWCKNAKSDVVIVEMIPFAPFIGLAVVVQILRYLLYIR